jgi:hypothetical protein
MDDSWYVGSKGPEWVVTLRRLGPGDLFRRRVKKVAATEEGLKKEKQELLDLVKEQHTGEMTEAAVKKLGAAIDKWHISKTPVADIEARRATFLENAVSFGPTVAHCVGDLLKTETFRNQGFHGAAPFGADDTKLVFKLQAKFFANTRGSSTVHRNNGKSARIITVCCCSQEEAQVLRSKDTQKVVYNLQTAGLFRSREEQDEYIAVFDRLLAHVAREAHREVGHLNRIVHFLQSEFGMGRQWWHQDGLYTSTGAFISLNGGFMSTEYLKYDQKQLSALSREQRKKEVASYWRLTKPPEDCVNPETWEAGVRSLGEVPAGNVTIHDQCHIHRAPPPPKEGKGIRCVAFCAFENENIISDGDHIFSHAMWLEDFLKKTAPKKRRR